MAITAGNLKFPTRSSHPADLPPGNWKIYVIDSAPEKIYLKVGSSDPVEVGKRLELATKSEAQTAAESLEANRNPDTAISPRTLRDAIDLLLDTVFGISLGSVGLKIQNQVASTSLTLTNDLSLIFTDNENQDYILFDYNGNRTGLRPGFTTEKVIMDSDFILGTSSIIYNFLDPNGQDRNIALPENNYYGFFFRNIGSANVLNINYDSLLVVTLNHNEAVWLKHDGYTWQVVQYIKYSANYATQSYVDQKITDLIAGAPAAYDTLIEIYNKLASDDDQIAAMILTIAGKVAQSAYDAFVAAQAAKDSAQDSSIAAKVAQSVYDAFVAAQAAKDSAQDSVIAAKVAQSAYDAFVTAQTAKDASQDSALTALLGDAYANLDAPFNTIKKIAAFLKYAVSSSMPTQLDFSFDEEIGSINSPLIVSSLPATSSSTPKFFATKAIFLTGDTSGLTIPAGYRISSNYAWYPYVVNNIIIRYSGGYPIVTNDPIPVYNSNNDSLVVSGIALASNTYKTGVETYGTYKQSDGSNGTNFFIQGDQVLASASTNGRNFIEFWKASDASGTGKLRVGGGRNVSTYTVSGNESYLGVSVDGVFIASFIKVRSTTLQSLYTYDQLTPAKNTGIVYTTPTDYNSGAFPGQAAHFEGVPNTGISFQFNFGDTATAGKDLQSGKEYLVKVTYYAENSQNYAKQGLFRSNNNYGSNWVSAYYNAAKISNNIIVIQAADLNTNVALKTAYFFVDQIAADTKLGFSATSNSPASKITMTFQVYLVNP